MNETSPISSPGPRQRPTTQAAEGLPRLAWTLEEFERLSDMGFFGGIDRPRERVELVEGELVPMNAKGARHERVRGFVQNYLSKQASADIWVLNEPGWRPDDKHYLEPEILICRADQQPSDVRPADVLLIIEIADTSFAYDTGLKARIYAKLGVTEYWVVEANTLVTRIHTGPAAVGYATVADVPAEATLAPARLPGLTICLSSLGIDRA